MERLEYKILDKDQHHCKWTDNEQKWLSEQNQEVEIQIREAYYIAFRSHRWIKRWLEEEFRLR